MHSPITRRAFCATAALALARPACLAAAQQPPFYTSARPDVAAIDRDRILEAAAKALTITPAATPTADAAAILALSRQISALAAAFHLTRDEKYPTRAAVSLRAWFLDPETRLNPTAGTTPESVLDTLPLAELAQSIPFLAASDALPAKDLAALKAWFTAYLTWLTESRRAALARDRKDHHGTSWLLQAAAFARLTLSDPILADLRHRFKTVTLRAQLVAGGTFPHELSTPYPYRNSLFALDLLAGCCQLLSTQFESLWEFELQDGPGLRSAIAFHARFIQDRRAWPYPSDLDHFTDLPVRNPSLLFAARAYNRPEYAALWRTLNPEPTLPELQRTFPIAQPLLWVAQPRRPTYPAA